MSALQELLRRHVDGGAFAPREFLRAAALNGIEWWQAEVALNNAERSRIIVREVMYCPAPPDLGYQGDDDEEPAPQPASGFPGRRGEMLEFWRPIYEHVRAMEVGASLRFSRPFTTSEALRPQAIVQICAWRRKLMIEGGRSFKTHTVDADTIEVRRVA